MVIGPGRCLVLAVRFRLSVYHTTRFSTVFRLVWHTPISERFPESLENGGFCDSLSATPRNVKAHITWCGTTESHTLHFSHVLPLVWPSRHGILSTAIGGEVRSILP